MDEEILQEKIRKLIQELGSGDSESARNDLVVIGEPAVPALLVAFKNRNVCLRWKASEALAKIGKPAVPALIEALKNKNVRSDAAEALGKIGDARAIPALIYFLIDADLFEEVVAVRSLVQIGKPAVPALTEVLNSGNSSVQIKAALALGEIGFDNIGFNEKILCMLSLHMENDIIKTGKPAVPALIETLKDENSKVRENAAQALEKIGFDNIGFDEKILCLLLLKNIDEIIKIGKSAIPALSKALKDTNELVRGNAALALRKIFNNAITAEELKEFESKLQEGYDRLREKYGKEDLTDVRMQIAKLKMECAKRKNELAEDKGVLLDDKPKPPKKGIYQQLRRIRNG